MVTTFETLPQSQAHNRGDGPVTASMCEGQGQELGSCLGEVPMSLFMPRKFSILCPGIQTALVGNYVHESFPCLCVWMGEYGVSGECLMGKTCGSPYSQVESDCH